MPWGEEGEDDRLDLLRAPWAAGLDFLHLLGYVILSTTDSVFYYCFHKRGDGNIRTLNNLAMAKFLISNGAITRQPTSRKQSICLLFVCSFIHAFIHSVSKNSLHSS